MVALLGELAAAPLLRMLNVPDDVFPLALLYLRIYLAGMPDYCLRVVFDDGRKVLYDVKEDIDQIESYRDLETIHGLFNQVQLDPSRTCVYWNDEIDLPSDTLYEYGKAIAS